MIQRIQTVYLLAAAACLAALFFLPSQFAQVISTAPQAVQPTTFYANLASPTLLGVAAMASLGAIFLFKNRPRQILIARLAMLDVVLFAVVAAVFFYLDLEKSQTEAMLQFGWATALPVVAIGLIFMAIRSIKKDENLVRSADRLR